jgi:hypothetical protein
MKGWIKINEHAAVKMDAGHPTMLRVSVSEKANVTLHVDAISVFVGEPLSLVGVWRRKGTLYEVACKRASRD